MNQISVEDYQQSQLSADVMRRVWVVYFVRRVVNSEVFKGAIFGACCVTAIFLVSVPHVIQNMMSVRGIVAEVAYLMGAFLNTSLIVEGVVVVAVVVGGLLMWDIGRNVGHGVGYLSQSLFMRGRSRV
jgi:predicted membrane protein